MHALPPKVEAALARRLGESERVLHAAISSFRRDGTEGTSWVVLTTRAVHWIEDDPPTVNVVPLDGIIGVEFQGSSFGDGSMILLGRSGTTARIRFASSSRAHFEELTSLIRKERDRRGGVRVDPFKYVPDEALLMVEQGEPVEVPEHPAPTRREYWVREGPSSRGASLRFSIENHIVEAGSRVSGTVTLSWPRSRVVRGVRVVFTGAEETSFRKAIGGQRGSYTEFVPIVGLEAALFGAHSSDALIPAFGDALKTLVNPGRHPVLGEGRYRGHFSFPVPETAPSSYRGAHASIEYKVKAWVDIPLAFDLVDSTTLTVIPRQGLIWPALRARFRPEERGLMQAPVGLRLQIEGRNPRHRGPILGTFRFENPNEKKITGVLISLFGIETARAQGRTEQATVLLSTKRLGGRVVRPGVDIPFRLPDPTSAGAFAGSISSYDIGVKVELEVDWAKNVQCHVFLRAQ